MSKGDIAGQLTPDPQESFFVYKKQALIKAFIL